MAWLGNWHHRKLILRQAATGGTTNYVEYIQVYCGAGTDGQETLTGGHNGVVASKVYLENEPPTNFADVNFTASDGVTRWDFHKDTYTASTSALFGLEVRDDVSAPHCYYIYWGGGDGVDRSSAADTYKRVISSGVVLALPMNEGAGLPQDYSGNGNHAVANAGATWVTTGKYGAALDFDGADDFLTVNDSASLSPTGHVSESYWMYPHAAAETSGTVWKAAFNYISWQQNTTAIFYIHDGVGSSLAQSAAGTIVNNTMYNIMGVFSDVDHKSYVYVNNVVGATVGAVRTGIRDQAGNLFIGQREDATGERYFDGVIGPVFIFNYSLTSGERDDLYAYYPQCSSANLGTLYLRSYVNPEPQPQSIQAEETWEGFGGPIATGETPKKREPNIPEPPIPREFFVKVYEWLKAKTMRDS